MMRKYLYISILLVLSVLSATAQTNLHKEVLMQTDTIALYRRNCQKLLYQRIWKGQHDSLLEVVDFYSNHAKGLVIKYIDSTATDDAEKYLHPKLVSTNALLGICLLNGDYDRFFATLPDFPEYIYDDNSESRWEIESAVKRSIADDAERWNTWLATHPMTDEQRTLAQIYLTCAGVNEPQTINENDKAYRLCAKAIRKPQYEPYQNFLSYGIGKFETSSFNLTVGYQMVFFSNRLYKYLNSNHLLFASATLKDGHTHLGVSVSSVLSSKYKGDTTSFATYNDRFSIGDGQKTNYTLFLLELGYRIGMPRRVSFWGLCEFGVDRLNCIERIEEDGHFRTISHIIKPASLVAGVVLKSEIRLGEWNPQKLLLPDMGLNLNFSIGGRVMNTDAMLWASAGLTLFMY